MIRLNRNQIYLYGLLLLILLNFTPKIWRYLTWDHCSCNIAQVNKAQGMRTGTKFSRSHMTYYQPIAFCPNEKGHFYVSGPYYYDLESCYLVSEAVTVMYDQNNPKAAKFLNLSGFWFTNYIYKLLLLMGISIFIYSFIHKSQFFIIRFHKKEGEKFVELTRPEKDAAMIKKLKWAREAMFRKPRR